MPNKTRNTLPRNLVYAKENTGSLRKTKLKQILDDVTLMSSEELTMLMTAITHGLIRQRDIAGERAVDMETVAANMVKDRVPTPATCRFVLKEFVEPHASALRTGSFLIDKLKQRGGVKDAK